MKFLVRLLQILGLAAVTLLAFAARCHNLQDTLLQGRIYFVDDDCYSRMTRVQLLEQHPGSIIRHHDFENYPAGVDSHATAPLDYLILTGKALLDVTFARAPWGKNSVLAPQTRDLAGALVSPLLGAATALFLALWGWRITATMCPGQRTLRVTAAIAPSVLFSLSSILLHGTLLGRPDHQSLLIFLLTISLGAEAMLLRPRDSVSPASQRRWAIVAGVAWGLAIWVSLFEPPILLAATALLILVVDRRSLRSRDRAYEAGCIVGIALLFLLLEGWRFHALAPEVIRYFPAWSRTIGELSSVAPFSPIFRQWVGYLCFLAPALLVLACWRNRQAGLWIGLLLLAYALTCWQIRWSYFFALLFCLSLPWQLVALRRWWLAAPLFLLSLFGVAEFWDGVFFPAMGANEIGTRRREKILLRDIASHLQGDRPQPFIAPWWESPALAYWSGQPGVGGSSHESLPGIVDVSTFYTCVPSPTDDRAQQILRRRKVAYVVVDDAARMLEPATALLGTPAPPNCLAYRLNDDPNNAVPFLEPIYANSFFKVFAVDRTQLGE